jgi:hypothetical protein
VARAARLSPRRRGLAKSQDSFDVEFRENMRRMLPPFVNVGEPGQGITEIFDSQGLGRRRADRGVASSGAANDLGVNSARDPG